ncbi:MAG TPA: hypothetical protein VM056_05025 [Terriglobales bacterium]|nr:hypothetical protein [Terriglobales bacterium]
MKSIQESLQQKEQDFKRLEIEIGILRAAQSILEESELDEQAASTSSATMESGTDSSGTPAGAGAAPARNHDWVISSMSPSAPYTNASGEPKVEATAQERPHRAFP